METAAGDVTEQATNAGDERAADGGALRSKFNSRDGASTNVESDLRDGSFDGGNPENPEEQIPTELLNPEPVAGETPAVPETGTETGEAPTEAPTEAPVIKIEGSEVSELTDGTSTGDKVIGQVTITLDKPQETDLIVELENKKTGKIKEVTIEAGKIELVVDDIETSRVDDAYKQGTTNETISIKSTSNSEIFIENKTATITIQEDKDPVNMTITATVTTPKIIDVNTKLDGSTGVKMYVESLNGKADLSVIKGTNHNGFGVLTTNENGKSINKSNGDTKELGVDEKIVIEFTDGKDVNSLDVSFAWRNNHETAKLTFIKDDKVVGFATVDGDGKSTTKAIVKYYDEKESLIKEVNAKGSSDKVDEAFTFELPASKELGADLVSFDRVEFSAPKNKDDYLIHEIKYKEVLDPEVTDIITDGGKVTFNIQMDENYPPQGKATTTVEVDGETYQVELNATGRGTLTIDSSKLSNLSKVEAKVIKVEGGKYEDVNLKSETFDFTPTLKSTDDSITTDEDVPYTLTINDFGDISESTKEFKITEVPTNGKLTLSVTTGETIVDKEGNQTTVTQDSKVEITEDKIVTLAQVGAGKVEFVPNKDTDNDGSFKFQVGDGEKFSKTEYETKIIVNAVADAPDLNIELTKIETASPELIKVGENLNANDSYEMKISAKLTDTDGSESLSNVSLDASTFPEGAELFDLSGNKLNAVNGKYDIALDEDGTANVKLEGPKDFDTDGIQANAISTDGSEAVSNAISFAGGGDIDLSNLKDIVNLKEINLDNGKENKLSLTLDDVLKISGDDGKIKITGDKFDSVTLKNEEGKTWQEGSPVTEDSKTFETYTNIGDSTVQVKVEEKISDGVTS